MRNFFTVFFLLYSFSSVLNSQIVNKIPLSERQTTYKIDAKLDVRRKVVEGDMQAWWVNKSGDFVPDVRLHMYLNAFRSKNSTFNKESGTTYEVSEKNAGRVDILAISDKDGNDLSKSIEFISPDDGNADDKTVLKIGLLSHAKPGDTVFLNIKFESKLPSKIIRTGYTDDYYFVAQWFPKFGVYEPAGMRFATSGSWNCHQFHENSEFYSNHSVYDVSVTVPESYVTGSCGMELGETKDGSGNKTIKYRAEDIVDFAWTAWPGYTVYTEQWKHVKITLLIPKERYNQVERQFTAVKHALEYFDKNVGKYPWPHLTVVDPPSKGAGAEGMEYTTMFTSQSVTGAPSFIHLPETVTVHEFGHAYFMGIFASNEFEEPWLDEGVNSFFEGRIIDGYYGKNSGFINHPWLKVSDLSLSRISYISSPSRQATTNSEFSWNYPHGTYGMMSYNKASVVFQTLMGIVGEETINNIFSEYYAKWAFKQPSGRDFIKVVNDVVRKDYGDKFGLDMNWFFNQTLYGSGICDYKVSGIINKKESLQQKIRNDSANVNADLNFEATVQLERLGDVTLPVTILVWFENGTVVLETWDGMSRFKDFSYHGKGKIGWAKIDPGYTIKLDVNQVNNSRTVATDMIPLNRMKSKMSTILQMFLSLISI